MSKIVAKGDTEKTIAILRHLLLSILSDLWEIMIMENDSCGIY